MLAGWLEHLTATRLQRPDLLAQTRSTNRLSAHTLYQQVDKLDLHAVFTCDAAQGALPAGKPSPIVSFKYGKCLGKHWCNAAEIAKHLIAEEPHAILHSSCACDQQRDAWRTGLDPRGL